MKPRLILTVFLSFFCLFSFARKEKEVKAKATYQMVADINLSIKENRSRCLEQAKVQAIADAFGINITDIKRDERVDDNGDYNEYFFAGTELTVRGRWMRDTKAPELKEIIDDKGQYVITYTVDGIVREVSQMSIDIHWDVLVGTPESSSRGDMFNSGQRIFVEFKTPEDGYVAVYLYEESSATVSRLLPYRVDGDGRFEVKKGKQYVFFDKDAAPMSYPYYYQMSTKEKVERNRIYILYSPNPIASCYVDRGDSKHPDSTSFLEFQKWLDKMKAQDENLFVDNKWLTIKK